MRSVILIHVCAELTTPFLSTPHVVESGHPSVLIQAHFIEHSTRLPHPLASTPVLEVCILKDRHVMPMVNAVIAGDNLALVVSSSWEGDLSVWNWRTGVKKGEVHVPEPRLGLHFLREDLLLNGNLTNMSLDIYRISEPNSTPWLSHETEGNEIGANHVRLVHSLGLPRINEIDYETIEIFCRSQPSFPLPPPREPNLPFISNPQSAILLIEVGIQKADWGSEPFRTFFFIVHRRTLLEMALEAMNSPIQDLSEVERVPWDSWGPHSTRMLTDDSITEDCSAASTGTRCIWLHGPHLEVLNFGCHQTDVRTMQRDDNEPDANGVQVHMVDTESIYPIATGPFTQDVRTNLPYVSSRRLLDLERPWDGVLMDDERIVGFTRSALHILHLQP